MCAAILVRTGGGDPERAVRHDLEHSPESDLLRRVGLENRIVVHNFQVPMIRDLTCPTCGSPYRVILIPGQIVYPGHCIRHRSAHRRMVSANPIKSNSI